MQIKSMLGAGTAADAASRDAAIKNAYISFGGQVDVNALAQQLGMTAADVQNAITPDVQRLAQENTSAGLSTQARLGLQNTDAIRQIRADLNKRGLLHSGEAGYQLDRENLSYRQAQSDATQKLLGALQQYQQGYLSAQQGRQGQLAQAYGDAADRQFQNNQGSAGGAAQLDHVDASGRPVYKGSDGNLYNLDGSPYVAPAAAPAGAEGTGGQAHALLGLPSPTAPTLPHLGSGSLGI